jgi:glucokinase
MYSLVGDFGGTNCRLALADNGRVDAQSLRRYRNADFTHPTKVLSQYLRDTAVASVRSVCFGVAGPVQDEQVLMTNYPWVVSKTDVHSVTGAQDVHLFNDLQAQGYALHGLTDQDVRPILKGKTPATGPRMVIAIGTGVNAAAAFVQNERIGVPASEAGHMAFLAADETDLEIAGRLRAELGHTPIEAVLSGSGLSWLWSFFGGPSGQGAPDVISAYAAGDKAAGKAVRKFSDHLARYCADLALIHLSFGGVFLAGSVGCAVAPHLRSLGFAKAFHRPGPYQPILQGMSVQAVPDIELTLRGCAVALAQGG